MLRQNECRLNFKNLPVRTGDIKGGPKQPPLPLIGVARSLPLIGLNKSGYIPWKFQVDNCNRGGYRAWAGQGSDMAALVKLIDGLAGPGLAEDGADQSKDDETRYGDVGTGQGSEWA